MVTQDRVTQNEDLNFDLAGPAFKEISSVTKLNKFAKGIIAKQLKKKMHPEGQLKI
ncbi:15127_t:CDS:2 [Racocetra fulgida]|uniref:15127_t:CDS:1 n=1 Tax=Racocetra fulgida TaxID=60492 RepID=A0A9N8ZFY6_9GLOM|nr:15127_t:CDS:2 [Racocetra fulgida]